MVHKRLAEAADPFPVTSATIVEAFNRPPSKIWGTRSWPGDHVDFEKQRRQEAVATSSAQARAIAVQIEAHPTGPPIDPWLRKKLSSKHVGVPK